MAVYGSNHMYREQGIIFDPEGLLSTIPATVDVIAGYLAGCFIVKNGKTYGTLAKLMIAGNLLLLASLYWNYFLPLNKKLWTSSYAVFTTGIDLIALGVIFYATEILNRKKVFSIFVAMGKNPLFIYVLSNLFLIVLIFPVHGGAFADWINNVVFQKLIPGPLGSLLFALRFTTLMALVAWFMDKKKNYIRI
jgi:predicted acyltransferase